MNRNERAAVFAGIGILCAAVLVAIGTVWAFQRGANDFGVFYGAWRLVLEGRGAEIYRATSDRYLYAPGFAWLLAGLGLFPQPFALGVWCFIKAALNGLMVRALGRRLGSAGFWGWGAAAWGLVLVARPLLIDFQYGQVNLLILAACVGGLIVHTDSKISPRQAFMAWVALAVAAVAKIYPLPLLLIPWMPLLVRAAPQPHETRVKYRAERVGSLLGVILVLAAPIITEDFKGTLSLYAQWREALMGRGMPLESHNQSFAAFLHHYFTDEFTHVIAQHASRAYGFGIKLAPSWVTGFTLAWMLSWAAVILQQICNPPRTRLARQSLFDQELRWIALLIGLLILPSYLVWKPYFVFGFPVAAWVVFKTVQEATRWKRNLSWVLLAVLFMATNLSGFDFVGSEWGGRLEAASLLLWVHIVYLGWAAE